MSTLLAFKPTDKISNNILKKYSEKEIQEIYELETNYSSPESFNKLWEKHKKGKSNE